MLFILIPIGWLSIVAFFVVLCLAAARGDAAMTSAASTHLGGRGSRRGLRLLEGGAPELRSPASGHLATRPRARTHAGAGAGRRPGCIAGS
jgi:hypothetical protein